MTFLESIKNCFKKYASFKGRASRSEYWYFTLFTISLSLLLKILSFSSFFSLNIVGTIVSILIILPSIAVAVRRLHDINKSGWWWLLNFTLVGYILVVGYWAVKSSDKGKNNFGPNPYFGMENIEAENKSTIPVPIWLLIISILYTTSIVVVVLAVVVFIVKLLSVFMYWM